MKIPSARAELLRSYQNALFYNPKEPKSERLYVFYLLVRPLLGWVKRILVVDHDLLPSEAESELYLLCSRLFSGFDRNKSSIVVYLSKYIPWKAEHLIRKVEKGSLKEEPCGLLNSPEESYEMDEEYYWKIPDILTTDRYIGNVFTRSMKYVTYNILISDSKDLTVTTLAKRMKVSRSTMTKRLNEIREKLENSL